MHILVTILGAIILVALVIYKINGKFEIKETLLLLVILVITSLGSYFFINYNKNVVPELFKSKYEKQMNTKILKISSVRVNNKQLSSKTYFVYDFDYIITKDKIEYLCSTKNVEVKKIEDEYIFVNFTNLDEKCLEK